MMMLMDKDARCDWMLIVFAVSIETSHEDDRYRKPVIRPFMIPIDHPPPPRDRKSSL